MLPSLRIPGVGAHLRVGPVTKTVLKVVASLLLLVVLLYFVDGRKVAAVLAGTNPVWLAVAVVGFLGGQALNALKWHWLGRLWPCRLAAAATCRSTLWGCFWRHFAEQPRRRRWSGGAARARDARLGSRLHGACRPLQRHDVSVGAGECRLRHPRHLRPPQTLAVGLERGGVRRLGAVGSAEPPSGREAIQTCPSPGGGRRLGGATAHPGHLARVGTSSLAIQLINWGCWWRLP